MILQLCLPSIVLESIKQRQSQSSPRSLLWRKISLISSEPHPKPMKRRRAAGEDGSDKLRFPYSSRASLPMPLGAMVPDTTVTV